ncbi:Cytidylate kinase [Mycolicibacterium chubuense]|uniref:Cytidylate kinase n=2 Tax=Mycolicibacterium chubuense TaxID=1800 RepID=A0A0J6ZDC2_MYCCU|nr:Cytidylate kinase [Mycolicibacterium chubuense]SPY00589.1 Predicted kinase [Mycolicibacterium chubuense]
MVLNGGPSGSARAGAASGTVDAMADVTAGHRVPEPWSAPGNLCAEVHETHTGVVTLLGARAYKAKKAVRTDFCDFTTVASRDAVCRRELELNRRLAPDSYEGIGYFETPTGMREPVVVMRRYPDAARLATLVRSGAPVEADLAGIAARLAHFHRGAARGPAIDAQASPAATAARWEENLGELRKHAGFVVASDFVDEIATRAARFLEGRTALFAQRIALRRIVDGHGDLLADDIFCLPDGPVLLDCLEFDDRLRYVDGVDDAAFLAMDLEFCGRADLAVWFLDAYRTEADDPAPRSLADFCVAYRAVVRAKVDCVRVTQGHADAAVDAQRHLGIAVRHLRSGAVRLVMIGGGPGTGKSTVARGLASRTGARVVSTDEVRRHLQDAGRLSGATGTLNAGLYAPDQVAVVYDEVLRRARDLLAQGWPVILDGTWRDAAHRQQARDVAHETASEMVEFICGAPVEAAARRVAERGPSVSDATPEIAAALSDAHGDWPQAQRLDTTCPLEESIAQAQQRYCAPA